MNSVKFNTQNSVAFLHTNSKQSENEIKETITFPRASIGIKYLEVNLTKQHTYH